MRFVLALVATLLGIQHAHAACAIGEAWIGTAQVPVGCPLVIYVPGSAVRPKVVAVRGDTRVDVTGAVTVETTSVPIFLEDNSCTGEGHTAPHQVEKLSIELQGAGLGDQLVLEGVTIEEGASVVAAGACLAPSEPSLYCKDDTARDCEDELGGDGGGCSSSRSSNRLQGRSPTGAVTFVAALGLIGFGLLRRRRRGAASAMRPGR